MNFPMKYFFATFILFFSLVHSAGAVTDTPVQNAGFAPANIWYSEDPFFVEDSIRIYTVIFNGSLYDLAGTVEFLDNDILIGKTDFTVSKGGRVRDVSVAWKATEGKHLITARTINVSMVKDGKKIPVTLENVNTGKSELLVELDTDGDDIGNSKDPDDDNDDISDIDEVRNGTDPLKKDTDGNGISDKQEIELVAKNATTTSVVAKGSIASTIKTVENAIPVPVKESVAQGANIVEQFRASEGYQFKLSKEEKVREIAVIKAHEDATATSTSKKSVSGAADSMLNVVEKPFAYILFGIFAALQYFFEWQILFYGAILYVVYRLIKWAIRRARNR